MLGQKHTDFLIGEEPLDGDVGFFAASADADPPAAADRIAETTPGPQAGPLPADLRPGRGSASSRRRTRLSTRQLVVGVLLAACTALAAVVSLTGPKTPGETAPQAEPTKEPDRAERDPRRVPEHGRTPTLARQEDAQAADASRQGGAAATSGRRRSGEANAARRHPQHGSTALAAPQTASARPSVAEAGTVSGVVQATATAAPPREFDFER